MLGPKRLRLGVLVLVSVLVPVLVRLVPLLVPVLVPVLVRTLMAVPLLMPMLLPVRLVWLVSLMLLVPLPLLLPPRNVCQMHCNHPLLGNLCGGGYFRPWMQSHGHNTGSKPPPI